MNVSLTPQFEEIVRSKVSSGLYNNPGEVVEEALRLLEERDRVREKKLADLRKAIQEGIDSGPPEPWEGMEEIKRQARAEWEAAQAAKQV